MHAIIADSGEMYDHCYFSGVGRCLEGLHSIMRALSYHTQCCQLLWVSPAHFVYALWDQVWCKDRRF